MGICSCIIEKVVRQQLLTFSPSILGDYARVYAYTGFLDILNEGTDPQRAAQREH